MFNSPQRTNAQYQIASFANETSAQRFEHRRIDWKYRQQKKSPVRIINFRKKEIERVFHKQYGGWQLPDDDAGRIDLRIMLDHLAQLGEDRTRRWANQRAPWMSEAELDDLIDEVGPGKHWTPAALGKALNLDNSTRMQLNIRTIRPIDRTKAQLELDCRQRRAKAEAARRLKAGAKPHAASAAKLKPWIARGLSRATYYRHLKNETVRLTRAP